MFEFVVVCEKGRKDNTKCADAAMAAADGSEWIQEAVVRFLQGPCYTAPLMGFIDEKCTIFDTEEENKFEYSSVHEDFKKTVETLIADFLEEIGVTGEEFVAAFCDCVPR